MYPSTMYAAVICDVLITGWGITDEPVYLGIAVVLGWITLLLFMTCIGLQIKKY